MKKATELDERATNINGSDGDSEEFFSKRPGAAAKVPGTSGKAVCARAMSHNPTTAPQVSRTVVCRVRVWADGHARMYCVDFTWPVCGEQCG